MKPTNLCLVLLLILLLSAVNDVFAHAPDKPTDNESLATAYTISDPIKSWAIYAKLHEEKEAQYYKFEMAQNERLFAMLFVPTSEDDKFMPSLVVMGPGITSQDVLPEYLETVEGEGVMLLEAERPSKPTYEAFTPSSYYYLASLDQEVSAAGTYHIAVYESSGGGRYGLAIGYREEVWTGRICQDTHRRYRHSPMGRPVLALHLCPAAGYTGYWVRLVDSQTPSDIANIIWWDRSISRSPIPGQRIDYVNPNDSGLGNGYPGFDCGFDRDLHHNTDLTEYGCLSAHNQREGSDQSSKVFDGHSRSSRSLCLGRHTDRAYLSLVGKSIALQAFLVK